MLEHVHHVVEVDEGVVDGDHLSALGDRCPQNEPSNPSKPVDSDLLGAALVALGLNMIRITTRMVKMKMMMMETL